MEETNHLENCLSWMNEGEKTEFLMCVGEFHLSLITNCEFDITKYRSTVKALHFLYMKEIEGDF
jgi:hypothetical protein